MYRLRQPVALYPGSRLQKRGSKGSLSDRRVRTQARNDAKLYFILIPLLVSLLCRRPPLSVTKNSIHYWEFISVRAAQVLVAVQVIIQTLSKCKQQLNEKNFYFKITKPVSIFNCKVNNSLIVNNNLENDYKSISVRNVVQLVSEKFILQGVCKNRIRL